MKNYSILFLLAVLAVCLAQKTQAAGIAPPALQNAAEFSGSDISAENIGADFTLTGMHNSEISLRDFRGKTVVLLFGFTFCPDVCPSNLLTLADAVRQLGSESKKVQVVFVSIDPERDTPEVLAKYVPMFHSGFIGLTDKKPYTRLEKVKKQYRVSAQKVTRGNKHYLMEHSTGMYIIDAAGKTVLYEPHGQTAAAIAQDLRQIIQMQK